MVAFCSAINRVGERRSPDSWRKVTPRKIEGWLQDDVLEDPDRPGLGRGAGRAVYYTAEHVDRAVEVAELVRRWRSLDAVAVVLFLRRRAVPEARLRRAYLRLLDRLDAEIAQAAERGLEATEEEIQPATTQWSPQEVAEWAEPVLADRLSRHESTRRLRSRLAGQPTPETSLLDVAFGLAATALGAGSDGEFGGRLAASLGIPPELAADLEPALSYVTSDRIRAVVARATLAEFEAARTILEKMPKAFGELATTNEEFLAVKPAVETAQQLDTDRSRALLILLPLLFAELTGMRLDVMVEFLDSLSQSQLSSE